MNTLTENRDWPASTLAWRQQVAAFWSIAWPSLIVAFILFTFGLGRVSADQPLRLFFVGTMAKAAYLVVQGLLTVRLVRKRYRSFRIEVERNDGTSSRRLLAEEVVLAWLQIIWPQVLLGVLLDLVVLLLGDNLEELTVRALSSVSIWGNIFVAGPFGVYMATKMKFRGFRLRVYGQRYI
ncbi:MAG TPA: hypothetical protein VEU96_13315 [Bryobacteraceae bacterium]|nr:hypothetical protein [Bryobacteraceae bacterium]